MTSRAQPRIAPLPAAEWAEPERALLRGSLSRADRYLSGDPDGPPIPPILGLLARHPRIGGPWLSFSGALIDGGTLADRDRELLILRVGHLTDCRYLSTQHQSMGAAAGLGPEDLRALSESAATHHWNERDRHLISAAGELLDEHALSEPTWLGLCESFDEQQVLEILFLIGSYACLGMVLNSVGLELETKE
jgi:alkylhydroperoxidase family enzyme